MSLLSRLETKLESAVEGIFTRTFRGRIQPLEIARKIEKVMDESKILSVETAYAPNRFVVKLNPEDYDHLKPFAPTFLPELERYVAEHAHEIHCHLTDEPGVELRQDEAVKAGSLQILPEISEAPREVERKVRKKARASRLLLVVQNGSEQGRSFEIGEDGGFVGRSSDCLIALPEAGVSRHHARLSLENGSVLVEDMGSTNGTYVNNEATERGELLPGDVLSIGGIALQLKVVHSV